MTRSTTSWFAFRGKGCSAISDMRAEIEVRYTLFGAELLPDAITAATGLLPTRTWRKGDLVRPNLLRCHEESGWSIHSQVSESDDLIPHIDNVLQKLRGCWSKMVELGRQYEAELACIIYCYEAQAPAMHFEPGMLSEVAELNAAIDIDFYCLGERDGE